MSEAAAYSKCACDHCTGRIEFPTEAAGRTIDCPHCGAKTTLAASERVPQRGYRIRKRVALPIVFALVASALFLAFFVRPRSLVIRELHFQRASTNSPGAVTGVIENKSSRPKQEVRVEIDLLNARGEKLWEATDYAREVSGKGGWQFRAIVVDPNVITGKIHRIRTR